MKLTILAAGILGLAVLAGCSEHKPAAGEATPPRFPIGSTTGSDVNNGTAPAATDSRTAVPTTPAR